MKFIKHCMPANTYVQPGEYLKERSETYRILKGAMASQHEFHTNHQYISKGKQR